MKFSLLAFILALLAPLCVVAPPPRRNFFAGLFSGSTPPPTAGAPEDPALAAKLTAAISLAEENGKKLATAESQIATLTKSATDLQAQLDTALADKAAAEKAKTDFEASMPEKIKQAAIDAMAQSGVPTGTGLPPVGGGQNLAQTLATCGTPQEVAIARNAATYKVLAADDRVIKANKAVSGPDPVDTGIIENVAGFRVVEVPFLNTANATVKLAAIFGVPSSGIYASRPPRDPSVLFPGAPKNCMNESIIDPSTGHSMMHQEAVDNFALTAKLRDLHLFGTAKGIVGHAILGITT